MRDRLIPSRQQWAALVALALASALCFGLVQFRAMYSRQIVFTAFLWNLFLAWIPLAAALPIYALRRSRGRRWPVVAVCFLFWFLFFPNAPYIVTDLQHLHPRTGVPLWYDLITIMAFALTGLFTGYLSLYLMQEVVRGWFGRGASWAFALGMLGVSAFGIYLGRFVRWNSWDALTDPIATVTDAARIANPNINPQALAFSGTFFAFSLVCYLIVYSFTHLHAWVEVPPNPERR
jgi:uncharacterized membrane protein